MELIPGASTAQLIDMVADRLWLELWTDCMFVGFDRSPPRGVLKQYPKELGEGDPVTSTARVIGIPAGRRILSYFFGSAKK
jgi:hypothetical protein